MPYNKRRGREAIGTAIEGLETRRLFAVLVTPVDTDGDTFSELIITGDGGNNRVLVYDDDQGDRTDVVLDANNNGAFDLGEVLFQFAIEFEEIEATLHGGNDTLRYFFVTDVDVDENRRILADFGSGDNKLVVSSPTSGASPSGISFDTDGADLLARSDVVIQAVGSSGKDTFNIDLSRTTFESSRAIIDLDGGGGSDTFKFKTPDFNQGEDGIVADDVPSQVQYTASGGSGTTNTYAFDIFSDIENDSNLDIEVAGGTAKDQITSNFAIGLFSNSGETSRSGLNFDANLGDGADSFLGNIDLGTLGSFLGINTQARFNVNGQASNDIIRYRDVTSGGGDSADIRGLLDLSASGGSQHDTVTCDLDTFGGARLSILATGEFRSIMNGNTGNDTVFIDLVTGEQTVGLLDLAVLGGSGDDKVSLALKDDGSATYVGNAAVLDGGLGNDKWDIEGNGQIQRSSAEVLDESLQSPQ